MLSVEAKHNLAPVRPLSRLLQLASPLLPVGAYSYSQGLEWAIESGDVYDQSTAMQWLHALLHGYLLRFELPILFRLFECWRRQDIAGVRFWDADFQAGRDSAETLAETRQMGYSLRRLLLEMDLLDAAFTSQLQALSATDGVQGNQHHKGFHAEHQPAFPTVFAAIAVHWQLSPAETLHGYAWSVVENQVSAAMKAVPLGQVAGQRLLLQLGDMLPEVVEKAIQLDDASMSNFNPGLSIASCQHETQYTRLFRS